MYESRVPATEVDVHLRIQGIYPVILLYLLRYVFVFLYESLCFERDILARQRYDKHSPICTGLISHFTSHNSNPLQHPNITVFPLPIKNVLNVSFYFPAASYAC